MLLLHPQGMAAVAPAGWHTYCTHAVGPCRQKALQQEAAFIQLLTRLCAATRVRTGQMQLQCCWPGINRISVTNIVTEAVLTSRLRKPIALSHNTVKRALSGRHNNAHTIAVPGSRTNQMLRTSHSKTRLSTPKCND